MKIMKILILFVFLFSPSCFGMMSDGEDGQLRRRFVELSQEPTLRDYEISNFEHSITKDDLSKVIIDELVKEENKSVENLAKKFNEIDTTYKFKFTSWLIEFLQYSLEYLKTLNINNFYEKSIETVLARFCINNIDSMPHLGRYFWGKWGTQYLYFKDLPQYFIDLVLSQNFKLKKPEIRQYFKNEAGCCWVGPVFVSLSHEESHRLVTVKSVSEDGVLE